MIQQRILIEGIGGIGGVLAAKIIQAGYAPVLVTNNQAITDAIKLYGLRIKDGAELYSVPVPNIFTALEDVPFGDFDAAYLIMKADGVVTAAKKSLPLLKPDGYVVTFQNGIVEDIVAEAIGAQRVISGIIGWGGTMDKIGMYEKTTIGNIHLGELDGKITERLKNLATVCETCTPVIVTDNIRGALWSKLAINCTITTIGALTGETLGQLVRDGRVRKLFLRTYAEVVDTAEASGIRLERIATDPKLLYLPRGANFVQALFKNALVRVVGMRYSKQKSSSLQSLERGRKTEIDYLNGYVVRQAQNVNVPTPVNAALVRMMKAIESGQRKVEPRNVEDLQQELKL
ncbi:MAG: 2-dehydropantoate 2-reductase [Chloroflexi bacterium]|nr:2-dehydropantoate 2-reductase [Chloroflexota bacterium]